jgi:hypothetical protein
MGKWGDRVIGEMKTDGEIRRRGVGENKSFMEDLRGYEE